MARTAVCECAVSSAGISTSNLCDGIVVIHVPEDNKQKVER